MDFSRRIRRGHLKTVNRNLSFLFERIHIQEIFEPLRNSDGTYADRRHQSRPDPVRYL